MTMTSHTNTTQSQSHAHPSDDTIFSYTVRADVTASWAQVKCLKDYEESVGDLIFHYLFEVEPGARKLFHFDHNYQKHGTISDDSTTIGSDNGDDFDEDDEVDISSFPHYATTLHQIVNMIDCTVQYLAVKMDTQALDEELSCLGRRHLCYGVRKEFIPVMEKAVLYALEELLGPAALNESTKRAWHVVFSYISNKIMQSMDRFSRTI